MIDFLNQTDFRMFQSPIYVSMAFIIGKTDLLSHAQVEKNYLLNHSSSLIGSVFLTHQNQYS